MKNNKVLIGLIVSVLFGGSGIYGGYYTLKAKAERTEKDIEKLEEKSEEAEDKIDKEENINIEQTVLIKNIQTTQQSIVKVLEKLNEKIDKELEDE